MVSSVIVLLIASFLPFTYKVTHYKEFVDINSIQGREV
jgi:hypothetical protein